MSDQSKVERLQRVDFIGGFLISITILTFFLLLELANTELPWNRPGIYYCLATSVAIGVLKLGEGANLVTKASLFSGHLGP